MKIVDRLARAFGWTLLVVVVVALLIYLAPSDVFLVSGLALAVSWPLGLVIVALLFGAFFLAGK